MLKGDQPEDDIAVEGNWKHSVKFLKILNDTDPEYSEFPKKMWFYLDPENISFINSNDYS
jgi:hypothetical protein